MSTSFLRTTVRSPVAAGGLFVPETPARFFAGADEMSIVVVARLRTLTWNVLGEDVFLKTDVTGGNTSGYTVHTLGNVVRLATYTGVGLLASIASSRPLVAADVGKVHRFVAVQSIADGSMRIYTNGEDDGTADTVATYAASTAAVGSILGALAFDVALEAFEVLDIAAIAGRAFSATEVKQLDQSIRATGRVPSTFADWDNKLDADRLFNHSLVWDLGGRNAGRGMLCRDSAGAPMAPMLSSVLIRSTDWGGSGT